MAQSQTADLVSKIQTSKFSIWTSENLSINVRSFNGPHFPNLSVSSFILHWTKTHPPVIVDPVFATHCMLYFLTFSGGAHMATAGPRSWYESDGDNVPLIVGQSAPSAPLSSFVHWIGSFLLWQTLTCYNNAESVQCPQSRWHLSGHLTTCPSLVSSPREPRWRPTSTCTMCTVARKTYCYC